MKLNHKRREALFILAILCVGLPAQAQDKPGAAIPNAPVEDKRLTPIVNPAIDMKGFLLVSEEAAKHRETRRLTEEEFILMSQEPGAVILDARSAEMYKLLHVKGAINLSFPDIAIESLKNAIPDKDTRILIYCNNNFRGAEKPFATKVPSLSLNLSTYIALYASGYRNIYELGPLIDIAESKLEFETSFARELWPLMGINNASKLEVKAPIKQESDPEHQR
ncbi:MAG TPA: rhodanese-like domain-containing protein [Blastocatellia bacterium]